jgi:hypothetical protein
MQREHGRSQSGTVRKHTDPLALQRFSTSAKRRKKEMINFDNLNGTFFSYLTRRDTNPPYKEGVYMFPTILASIRLGRVFASKAALLHLTAACSSSRLK